MKKRVFVLAAVLALIAALFTLSAFAADPNAGYTEIGTADEFVTLMKDSANWSKNYRLTADIDLTGKGWNQTIGDQSTAFTGIFDGNGKTIKGLSLSISRVCVGLFGTTRDAEIRNLTVEGTVKVTGKNFTGGLIGAVCGETLVEGCTSNVEVTGVSRVGGLIGGLILNSTKGTYPADSRNYTVIIRNCTNKGKVSSTATGEARTGGLIGAGSIGGDFDRHFVIEDCRNEGTVNVKGDYAGGIIGYTFDGSTKVALTIDKCVNNGKVTAYIEGSALGQAGGMVGYVQNNKGAVGATVKNSINNGDVISGCQTGGIAGYVYGAKEEYITIENCINTGNISAIEWASPFVAYTNNNSTVVKNSISTGKLSALVEDDTKNRLCIVGLSSADVKAYTYENIFLADGGTAKYFSYANNDNNAANRFNMEAVLDKNLEGSETVKAFTRGELNADLITKANTAIGSELFALKDGKVAFASVKAGSTLSAGSTPSGGGSTPTGDTAAYVAVAAVAAVAILGTALVSKKRTIAE